MTMHDPRNVVRGLGCMVRSIEWARYSDSLKRNTVYAESILQKNCNTDRRIGKKRMALEYHHRISKKKRARIPGTNHVTEEERLPEADSCRKEKQAAVKSGRIPEERVGKKRAPASGRVKQSTKKTKDDARKGRKKRQSANLHSNDEAVLIIRRVSVGRDTTLSRKQKEGKEDGEGGLVGGCKRSTRSIS
ncbi:hypothetical protein ALC60_06179 [Trachymyrmex zeteki]|uniref:Uncharacterized protein n=1 Tax=Mycetomoellerius zeteki TaxID=64791 RepID=A0A151X3I0_9HYME|nr:hypothetical protein ALC60_06179 [Trachymyrmex zeteki]